MSQMRLRYIMELASNIGRRSTEEARLVEVAQRTVRRATTQTTAAVTAQGVAVQQTGAAATESATVVEQAQTRIGAATRRTTAAIGAMVPALRQVDTTGSATLQRQAQYIERLETRWRAVTRAAEGAARATASAGSAAVRQAPGVIAGGAAAVYAYDRMTREPMAYGTKLRNMANTAWADGDEAARKGGIPMLDAAIRTAVRVGGGTKDDAADTLDSLISSGTMSRNDAMLMLPQLMRAATAANAAPVDLGTIAARGMQSFGLRADQVPEMIDIAIKAGATGGFELKDMAKYLPEAMAAGSQSGLTGIEGYRRIVASMQASVVTAGSKDQAGNNVVNLLAKLNSADTAVDTAKVGVDLPGRLARGASKGVNSIDTFIGIVDELSSREPEYRKLKQQMGEADTPAQRQQILGSMATILQGKAVGKVVQDRQALMALLGEINNRDYVQKVLTATRSDLDAVGTGFNVRRDDPAFARQQAINEAAFGAVDATNATGPATQSVYESAAAWAREWPLATSAVAALAGVVGTVTAALGVNGLLGVLKGGVSGGAGAGGLPRGAPLTWPKIDGVPSNANTARVALGRSLAFLGLGMELFYTSPADIARLERGERMRQSLGGGFNDRRMQITAPGETSVVESAVSSAGAQGVGTGEILVRVQAEPGTQATASVTQQPSNIKLRSGDTNPGGYR